MNNSLFAAGVGCLVIASGCSSFERDRDFDGRPYVGVGGLASLLEPATDGVDGIDVDNDQSFGGSALLGYDISNRFSVEGNYSVLGTAELSPSGEIDYSVAGLSALIYGLNSNENRARREGFSAFGRAGVGKLDTSGSGVDFEQVNDFNLLLGLGVEYGLRNGLGLRAELVAHDEDVKYGQLALLYRFGDVESRRRRPAAPSSDETSPDAPSAPTLAVPKPAPSSERIPTDSDRDGVAQADDRCPDTLVGHPVDDRGCDVFGGAMDGVDFASASDTLTDRARSVLDGVAAALIAYPLTSIRIEAHTDNTGSAESNLQLSRRRAISVARYLVSQGVAGERLRPRAFGESQPRVSNATSEGRAQNRRVEFFVNE